MKPDKKYMSQISVADTDINFTPPSFSKSLFRNEPNVPYNNNSSLDLFPSETESSQLYCYYSSFNDCDEKNSKIIPSMRIPTPSEILQNFDLDLDETDDLERDGSKGDVNRIYTQIEKNNPSIFTTFSSYGIPSPITKVIIKRSIKLSLMYYNKEQVIK